MFDDFRSGSSEEKLSLDPGIPIESLQLLLDNGLKARFPELINAFEEYLQRVNNEQEADRNTIAEQKSIILEGNLRKAESLLRHSLLHWIFSNYPYGSPFVPRLPH